MKDGFEGQFVPTQTEVWSGKGSVLVFAPHPDDEVFGCCGAIIRHVQNNDPVHVMILTDGALGNPEFVQKIQPESPYDSEIEDYIELRKRESLNAAMVMNCRPPEFWGIKDRTLEYGEKFVKMVLDQIEKLSPAYVYAPSLYEMHPDHRALSMIVLEAVRRAESCEPELYMYEIGRPIPTPNILLDITDIWEQKLDSVNCFKSQLQVKPFDEYIFALSRLRSYTVNESVKNVEAYFLIPKNELKESVVDIFLSESEYQRTMGLYPDMSKVPLVTVIIRTMGYNALYKKALDSVALQTYPNIEILVVDAKGDNSIKLPEWCGRFEIKLCSKNKQLPRSEAANFGLKNASGDYIIFLDEDDWFFSDHISNLVNAIKENLDFQVSYSGTRCIDVKGDSLGINFNNGFDPVLLLDWNYIPIHAVLFDARLLKKGCRFDETLDIYEDWDFWIQLSEHTDFYYVSGNSAVYRINPQGDSKVHCPDNSAQGKKAVYAKWRQRISLDQYYDLMTYVQKTLQIEELHKKISEDNHQIDTLNRQLTEKDLEFDRQLAEKDLELDRQLTEKDLELDRLRTQIEDLASQNANLSNQFQDCSQKLSETNAVLDNILRSRGFKSYIWLTQPIRFLKNFLSS